MRSKPNTGDALRVMREDAEYRRTETKTLAEVLNRFRRYRQAMQDSLDIAGEVFVDTKTGDVIDPMRIARITTTARPEPQT